MARSNLRQGRLLPVPFPLFPWGLAKASMAGTIIPLFSPPPGFSPLMVRYLMRLGYGPKVFAAVPPPVAAGAPGSRG